MSPECGLSFRDRHHNALILTRLVSDYERGRIRCGAEMAVRFAEALGISTNELLRPSKKVAVSATQPPSLKILRRMERIESLPLYRQRALLTTIDQFLAAADR